MSNPIRWPQEYLRAIERIVEEGDKEQIAALRAIAIDPSTPYAMRIFIRRGLRRILDERAGNEVAAILKLLAEDAQFEARRDGAYLH